MTKVVNIDYIRYNLFLVGKKLLDLALAFAKIYEIEFALQKIGWVLKALTVSIAWNFTISHPEFLLHFLFCYLITVSQNFVKKLPWSPFTKSKGFWQHILYWISQKQINFHRVHDKKKKKRKRTVLYVVFSEFLRR